MLIVDELILDTRTYFPLKTFVNGCNNNIDNSYFLLERFV